MHKQHIQIYARPWCLMHWACLSSVGALIVHCSCQIIFTQVLFKRISFPSERSPPHLLWCPQTLWPLLLSFYFQISNWECCKECYFQDILSVTPWTLILQKLSTLEDSDNLDNSVVHIAMKQQCRHYLPVVRNAHEKNDGDIPIQATDCSGLNAWCAPRAEPAALITAGTSASWCACSLNENPLPSKNGSVSPVSHYWSDPTFGLPESF